MAIPGFCGPPSVILRPHHLETTAYHTAFPPPSTSTACQRPPCPRVCSRATLEVGVLAADATRGYARLLLGRVPLWTSRVYFGRLGPSSEVEISPSSTTAANARAVQCTTRRNGHLAVLRPAHRADRGTLAFWAFPSRRVPGMEKSFFGRFDSLDALGKTLPSIFCAFR